MTIIEAAVLFGFGIPIVLGCTAFVVMACGMPKQENQKALDAPDKADLHGALLLPVKEITCNKSENLL